MLRKSASYMFAHSLRRHIITLAVPDDATPGYQLCQ